MKALLVSLGLFIAGALFGGAWVANEKNAEIASIKADQASAIAKAATAARDRLQAAIQRSDELETRLAEAEQDRQQQSREHALEIKRLTTGRPCLNAGTVRLLNQSGTGAHPAVMPEAIGKPAAADAAAGPDTDVRTGGAAATDTDVASWIDTAKRQYGTCRDRLQALIDWWGAPQK